MQFCYSPWQFKDIFKDEKIQLDDALFVTASVQAKLARTIVSRLIQVVCHVISALLLCQWSIIRLVFDVIVAMQEAYVTEQESREEDANEQRAKEQNSAVGNIDVENDLFVEDPLLRKLSLDARWRSMMFKLARLFKHNKVLVKHWFVPRM